MIRKYFIILLVFLMIPNIVRANTWFSSDGSSFEGSGFKNIHGYVDISTQSDSPLGNSSVWRWTFPNGLPGGKDVAYVFLNSTMPNHTQEMWVEWYWKYSPGFTFNTIQNKQMYFNPSNVMGMGLRTGVGVNLGPQGPNAGVYYPNVNKNLWYMDTGKWHKYRARYRWNSPGRWDGIWQAWVDDIMVADYGPGKKDSIYYGDNGEGIDYQSVRFAVIYGGMGGGQIVGDQYLYLTGIYIGSTDPGGESPPPQIKKYPMAPSRVEIK